MDSSSPLTILGLALFSATTGAFVAAGDAALSALPPGRLAALHDHAEGATKRRLARYIDDPPRVLARWLVARTFTTSATAILLSQLAPADPSWLKPAVAIGGSLLLLATLYELGAALARALPADAGPVLLGVLRPLEVIVSPIADPLCMLGRAITARFSRESHGSTEARLAEFEVEHLVEDAAKTGEIDAEPAKMIRNVLEFKDLTVRDVMVPRVRMMCIEADTPLDQVLQFVAKDGHTRYPVHAGRIDNIIGVLYAKDLFIHLHEGTFSQRRLRDLLRTKVNFVPETQPVSSVLRDMRARREHMALVVDEFGGVAGLVTLEDVIEQIVGEIRDEYDAEEAPIQDLGDGKLLADAAVSLADLSAYLGREIESDGDYGSIGGLLVHHAGKVPAAGDHLELGGIEFTVRERDERRIIRVEIVVPRPSTVTDLPAAPPAEQPSS